MIGPPRIGIMGKFNILIIALILTTSSVIAAFLIHREVKDSYDELLRHGTIIASVVSLNSEYALYTENSRALEQIIDSLKADTTLAHVRIVNRYGRPLIERGIKGLDAPAPEGWMYKTITYDEITNPADGVVYIRVFSPVLSGADPDLEELSERGGSGVKSEILGYVQLDFSLAQRDSHIRDFLITTGLFTSCLVLAGVVLTVMMTGRITSPIRKLAALTQQITEDRIAHEIGIRTRDEIGDLADAFNRMLERLRRYREQVREYQGWLEEKVVESSQLARKAEEASRTKSQFLANISHEIRTPMNGVLGMAEILLGTELTEKQRHLAETLFHSGESLLSLINDVLDFSKIEAGKLELEAIDFNLPSTVEKLIELFAERAQKKGLELIYCIEDDVPPALVGDPVRLQQIISNLVSNAVKFTDQGEVILRISRVCDEENAALLRFEVRDSGIGLHEKSLSSIFDAFSQADGSTTRKYGGTGLGLAICEQLCSAMGGEIHVESEYGAGSTFWFTARFALQPLQPDVRPFLAATTPPVRSLVVDDNAAFQTIFSSQLKSWGLICDSAKSVSEALTMVYAQLARGEPYKAIFLDMTMPGLSSLDLIRSVKAHPDLDETRIIVLSPVIQDGAEEAHRAGAFACITKPVRLSRLREILVSLNGSGCDVVSVQDFSTQTGSLEKLSCRVLLAEDNRVNQEVGREMLEYLGCRVDVANSGTEALRCLASNRYDLVFMDCQMPEMDGYEATRQIRETEHGGIRHTPIIALTANVMKGDRERCIEAGMDDHLGKPFKLEQIFEKLKKWAAAGGRHSEERDGRPPLRE